MELDIHADRVILPNPTRDGETAMLAVQDIVFVHEALQDSLQTSDPYIKIGRERGTVIAPEDSALNPDTCLHCRDQTENIRLIKYTTTSEALNQPRGTTYFVYYCPACAQALTNALQDYLDSHQGELISDAI